MEKIGIVVGCIGLVTAGVAADIQFPPPEKTDGKPLMEAFVARKSARATSVRQRDVSRLRKHRPFRYGSTVALMSARP